jgi:hypothetical protein
MSTSSEQHGQGLGDVISQGMRLFWTVQVQVDYFIYNNYARQHKVANKLMQMCAHKY